MSKKLVKWWEIWGAVGTIIIGSLLHFAYSWSGDNKIVALFAVVNESTWEHLKLVFWPTFIFAGIEWIAWGRKTTLTKNFCFAALVKLVSTPLAIIALFYGWLLFFHDNFIYDISIFVVAVVAGYYFGYKILNLSKNHKTELISQIFILLLLVLFCSFTYFPPKIILTKDPGGNYGINAIPSESRDDQLTTSDMATYSLGHFSLQYPRQLQNFKMIKSPLKNTNTFTYYSTYDPKHELAFPLVVSIYPIGQKAKGEFEKDSTNEQKIDVNISLDDLRKLGSGYSEILAIKKLSDRSLMYFEYSDYECDKLAGINIISPIANSAKYSNIIVNINNTELADLQPDSGDSACSYRESFTKYMNSILDGTADSKTFYLIYVAQKVAESAMGN